MKIMDWFNVYDMNHIKACKVLMDTGTWPEGFLPDDIKLGHAWQYELWWHMARAWADQVLAGNILGMPPVE